MTLILASRSPTRLRLIRAAGLDPRVESPRVDEEAAMAALRGEGHGPRAIADALAELKGLRVSTRFPEDLVIAADQTADLDGRALDPITSRADAGMRLRELMGREHHLHAAVVLAQGGVVLWRHVETARLTMGRRSEAFVAGYLDRLGDDATGSPVPYRIEGEGPRLMDAMSGDHFAIQGLPLVPLLAQLARRGDIPA